MGKRDKMLVFNDRINCILNNIWTYFTDPVFLEKRELLKNKELCKVGSDEKVCFVIGNGPSLKNVDLSIISKYPTISVNGFYMSDRAIKSTYHVLYDIGYTQGYAEHIVNAINKNPRLNFIVNKRIADTVKGITASKNKVYAIDASYSQVGDKIKFDLSKRMTGSNNVIPVAIECAMYMGFKNICLLGCDFSMYTQVNGAHFYPDASVMKLKLLNSKFDNNVNNVGNLIRCALIHKEHYSISKTAKQYGINIINATEGSLIDAYECMDLSSFLDYIEGLTK